MNRPQITVEEQQRINSYVQRQDVREYALYAALHAKPARAELVKSFLDDAPPEVRILLDGIASPNEGRWASGDRWHPRIVAGFVTHTLRHKNTIPAPEPTRRKPKPAPMAEAQFAAEMNKVINGDPTADKTIAAFWNQTRANLGVEVAVAGPDGIEVLQTNRNRS